MSTRTYARVLVFQFLFRLDFKKTKNASELEEFISDKGLSEKDRDFFYNLVGAVIDNIKKIDEMIKKHIEHWNLERLVITDKTVLRLGIGEMFFSEINTPLKVVINECIEIAKRFGTEDSGKFVNGVLDKAAEELKKRGKN
ncbi:MAG: transcription antitermination factor NusB [Candidatus Hydrogenedentota bacterium]